ncbi:MAG: hypothetical protein V9H69_06410 [Anaerolineae bacterium]
MKDPLATPFRSASRRWPSLVLLAGLMLLLAACRNQSSGQPSEILATYLPKDWVALSEGNDVRGFQEVNIDGDDDPEWLYFFHYDGQGDANGPIGGIIYDAQQDVNSQQPAAFFVPYRLLPDWRDGKGQGYLGETTVTWSQSWIDPDIVDKPANELVVTGLSAGNLPTRLSLFRWQGAEIGYAVAHFIGNAGVLLGPTGRSENGLIGEMTTYNRLNDRSRLCEKMVHTRVSTELRFAATQPAIVFCPLSAATAEGTPDQPTYPEAVVMTWLLNGKRGDLALNNAQLEALVTPAQVQRVVHVQYPGAATLIRGAAHVAEMSVQTALETTTGPRTIQWNLVELRPTAEERTSRWRIASAQEIR